MKYECNNHIVDENGDKFFVGDNVTIESEERCISGNISILTTRGVYLDVGNKNDKYVRADLISDIKLNSRKSKGIPVSERYWIKPLDELNVIVEERYISKSDENGKQEVKWKFAGYHPSLELAFKSIVDKELNESCSSTMDLVEKIKELKEFKKIINM